MKRFLIVGGADINNIEFVKSHIREDDFAVYCDCGLKHISALNKKPDLIIGDFDSYENPGLDVETIVLPHEKDDTDSAFAVKEGIKRGFDEFVLVGFVGARLDHTLGNVQLLNYLDAQRKKACIIDDYSCIEVVSDKAYVDSSYSYFSLLNITGAAEGVTITGAYYNLDNAVIGTDFPLGISNEVLSGGTACISIKKGKLLLIKVSSSVVPLAPHYI